MSGGRRFAARVLIGGAAPEAGALVRFEIDATRYGRCDAARVELAVDRAALGGGSAWFETLQTQGAEIGLQICDLGSGGAWVGLFQGAIDHVQWQRDRGVLVLECRDQLARLVDMRVQSAWANLTGAELITAMAEAAGLGASVDVPGGMTGQFWQIEHKRSALQAQHRFQTAFDLAAFVAREANCDLYADGGTVFCMPVLSPDDDRAVVQDVSGVVLERSLARDCQVASGVVVRVSSWDSRQRVATDLYYDGQNFTDTPPGSGVVHGFRVPGRRSEDVRAVAVGKYRRIVAHGLAADFRMAGIAGFGPRQFVSGLAQGGVWSGILGVDRVRSSFSAEAGFVQDVTARLRLPGEG